MARLCLSIEFEEFFVWPHPARSSYQPPQRVPTEPTCAVVAVEMVKIFL